ncbi:MAG: hypothetical protein DHS20C11_16400 [Lysobacteraceae bacterium]|nr:MAG: hypothetical protein DHS20C11_16400 [Xanthomonadaceae bacterium]
MQPIPVPISDVSVYPYIPDAPIEVPPVLTGASGTYSVGTLTTNIFYNMSLSGGDEKTPLSVGHTYYAVAKSKDGQSFQTHWMRCLTAGDAPTFGLTVNMLKPEESSVAVGSEDGPYIYLGELKDVNVSQPFRPPAIGSLSLISNAKGEWIGTRIGTPHLMGIQAENSSPSSLLHVGMDRINASGTRVSDGQLISYSNLVCVDAGNPAVFLQKFP